jgi:CxxC-x17-CxxC domain-containing protein
MKDFKRGGFSKGGRGGSGGGFGKPRGGFGGGFGGGDKQMHPATCSGCGKRCEVPFRPTAGKQVFCNDCFANERGGETFVRNERSDFRSDARPRFDDRASKPAPSAAPVTVNMDPVIRELQAVARKMDQVIELLSKQSVAKPSQETAKESKPAISESKPKKAAVKKEAAKKVSKKK